MAHQNVFRTREGGGAKPLVTLSPQTSIPYCTRLCTDRIFDISTLLLDVSLYCSDLHRKISRVVSSFRTTRLELLVIPYHQAARSRVSWVNTRRYGQVRPARTRPRLRLVLYSSSPTYPPGVPDTAPSSGLIENVWGWG